MDAALSAVEYLATVVEFDAWDKLDKEWTSNVALRNMTPENVRGVLLVGATNYNRLGHSLARIAHTSLFL